MGKAQKKRSVRRHNPTRVPDSHIPKGLDAAAQSSTKAQAVLPIIQKLDSTDPAERVWACAAVCNLIQNDPSTRRLLQGKNIVGTLITRLSDTVEDVVVEAAGALRNLCVDGGHEICAEMFNKNIMAPLKTFIPKISTVLGQLLENPKSAPENAQRMAYEFSENVITILWCLSETSNKALTAVNSLQLAPFLMSFLMSRDKLPIAVVTAAAQCLFVLSDDNDPCTDELRGNSSYIACLLEIAQSTPTRATASTEEHASTEEGMNIDNTATSGSDNLQTHLRVLACAILKTLEPLPALTHAAAIDIDNTVIIPLLAPLLSISLADACAAVQNLAPIAEQEAAAAAEKPSLKSAPGTDHRSNAERELDAIESRLRTVQLALELLTGVCATLPEPEPPVEGEMDGDAEVVDEDDEDAEWKDDDGPSERVLEMDVEPEMNDSTPQPPSKLIQLAKPLLALSIPTPLSFPPLPSSTEAVVQHLPTTSVLGAIHVRALECLSNIFLSANVQLDAPTARELWEGVWGVMRACGPAQTGPRIPGQERRAESLDAGMGVLWGVARAARGELVPEEAHVSALISACGTTTDERTQVKCIGVLECLAQHRGPNCVASNKVLAEFLLGLLPPNASTPTSVEPTLQAASAIIDIFSDEESPYDVNFRQGRWTERLSGAVLPLRKMIRAVDRRAEGGRELRARGDEVLENLVAFVKYRRNLGPGY